MTVFFAGPKGSYQSCKASCSAPTRACNSIYVQTLFLEDGVHYAWLGSLCSDMNHHAKGTATAMNMAARLVLDVNANIG